MTKPKRFQVQSTEDRINVFRACLDFAGEDLHDYINGVMYKFCLDVIENQDFEYADGMCEKVAEIFSENCH